MHTTTGHRSHLSDESRFSPAQCAALFAAVLVHDDIDLNATLPKVIRLDYSPEQLSQCYQICRQIWKAGVGRPELLDIVAKIYRDRALNPEDQLHFKHMRAKFKHLRFAYIACDQRHAYPPMLQWLTGSLGNLQDAFKHSRRFDIARRAVQARFFLSRPLYRRVQREVDQFQPCTTASFQAHVCKELDALQVLMAQQRVTSLEFHDMRKVISRQVALYDNLKILYPSSPHTDISRFLSTLNGLMGGLHDQLLARSFAGELDYRRDPITVPEPILQRLQQYVASCVMP